jgi:hypothetical protein
MHEVLAPCHERLLSCLLAPCSVPGVLPSLHDGQHLVALEDFVSTGTYVSTPCTL